MPAKNTTLVLIPSPWRTGSGVPRDERGGVGGGAAAAGRPGGGSPRFRRRRWRSGSWGSRGRWGCGCQRDRGSGRRRGRARVTCPQGMGGASVVQLNYRQTRNEPPEGCRMSKPLRRNAVTVPPCKLLLLSTFEILRDSQTGLGGISTARLDEKYRRCNGQIQIWCYCNLEIPKLDLDVLIVVLDRSGVKRPTSASGATKTRVSLRHLQLRCQHH